MSERCLALPDEPATRALGAQLARAVAGTGATVFLTGELGAGKTTLVRGFLRGRDYTGAVRSPTYTLLEPYETEAGPVYHLDLYRLGAPEEVAYLGLRDLLSAEAVCLVEWPERAADALPAPDLVVRLDHTDGARAATLEARTERGEAVLAQVDDEASSHPR